MSALESLAQGLAFYDTADRLVCWNAAYEKLWEHADLTLRRGATYESLVRHVLARGGYPAARGSEEAWLEERLSNRKRGPYTYESRNVQGVWYRHSHSPTADGGWMCISVDITSLKERELELQESRGFLEALIEHIPVMLVLKDGDTGRFTRLNRAGEELLGIPREAFLGKTDADLFPPEQARFFVERDAAALASNEVTVIEEEPITTAHNGVRFLHTRKVAVAGRGRSRSLLAICEDITEHKRASETLRRALEDAETANRAKTDFLATMSHEIRTPLNGVLGMAQAMSAEPLSDEQRHRIDIIRQSGETLLAILNDILDLAKVEAGKLELEDRPFDIEDVITRAYDAFAALADKKGLDFVLTMDPNARGCYRGDAGRLIQVLYNLISNALKFTHQGGVSLAIDHTDGGLRIAISDTGIGIAQADLPKLFQKFVQADASTTRRFGGTGLGLSLCRELVTLMGGVIKVRSEEGKGSVFEVLAPLEKVEAEATAGRATSSEAPRPESDRGTLRLLAAEDNEINQLVLRTLLNQIGVEPVLVSNGAEALAAWEAEPFDIVLMDVQMPVMDGPTAAQAIRRREAATGRPRIPIIALTANVMSHQTMRYTACGIDDVVAKPIEISELFGAIERQLYGPSGAGTIDPAPCPAKLAI